MSLVRQLGGTVYLLAALALPCTAAANPVTPYFAGELGYAALERSNDHRSRDDTLSLAFEGGIALSPALAVGLRAGGWTIAPYDFNTPEKGESLSLLSVSLRHHPPVLPRLLLSGHAGWVRHIDSTVGAREGSGTGLALGLGYDFPMRSRLCLTPVLEFSQGTFRTDTGVPGTTETTRYRALSLGIELGYSAIKK